MGMTSDDDIHWFNKVEEALRTDSTRWTIIVVESRLISSMTLDGVTHLVAWVRQRRTWLRRCDDDFLSSADGARGAPVSCMTCLALGDGGLFERS